MWHAYRYRAYPSRTGGTAEAERHIDIHRQLYNHALHDYNSASADDKPSKYQQQNKLPDWKTQWPVFGEVHSKAAQKTVHRLHDNLSSLKERKENGHSVGQLARQSPAEFRSVTYNQSGHQTTSDGQSEIFDF